MNNKMISRVISTVVLFSMLGYTLPVFGYTKDETVYSKLDASGNNYKTIVSTHIKNTENEDLINDLSDLLNVKNTSGDETYTQDGTKFTWNSNKNDIYYQGDTSKELPIECSVKYELNGKEISKDDIAGKSGNVKITLQYTNKEERIVDINGKKVKMYVPFVVVAGTIINNDNNKNVEVSSGKVINDGTKTVVIGMAMPGLQESLGLLDNEIEIPNNIEITMDATKFESNSIASYITPKVLDENDLDVFDKLDEVYSKVSTLQSSSKQILDGANTLKDGTNELKAGANSLKDGVETAYEGAKTISSEVSKSTQTLKADTSDALDSATLNSIKQQAMSSAVLTAEQKTQITAQAQKSSILTDEQKTAIVANAQQKYPMTLTDAEKALIISVAQNTATDTAVQTALTTAQNIATTTAVQTATTTAKQVGNQAKKTFTNQVISQMNTLGNGLTQLTNGLSQLNNGTEDLAEGTEQVNDGATALADGIKTFNEEGIQKICNYINGDAKNLTTRIEKLTELSKEYDNFTMLDDGNKGNVKFIMIIDAIKKQEESEQNKEEAILDTNIINEEK